MIVNSPHASRLSGTDEKPLFANISPARKHTAGETGISSATAGASTVSSLATQLATAAAYSAGKNKGLSGSELGEKARAMVDHIVGEDYQQRKHRNDREVSKATDPESLARATAATAFVNGTFEDNVGSEPNPFADLSPDQLATIAYDESGTFTVNERHAAWRESYRQEQIWRVQTIAKMNLEYETTGKLTNFFQDVLDHYQLLPLVEQVQYPKNYAAELKEKIKRDFNYRESVGLAGGSQDWLAAAKSFLRPMLESPGTSLER